MKRNGNMLLIPPRHLQYVKKPPRPSTRGFAVVSLRSRCSELKILASTTFNIESVHSGVPKRQLPNASFLPKISRVGSHLPRRHVPSITGLVDGRRDHPSASAAGNPLVLYPRRATQPVLGRKGKVANVPVQHLPTVPVPGPGYPTRYLLSEPSSLD